MTVTIAACSSPGTQDAPRPVEPATASAPPPLLADPRDLDPGERYPDGWFGYHFEIERVPSVTVGMTLKQVEHELCGLPVARSGNQDGTQSWIWYFEKLEELSAVEVVFRDGRVLNIAETLHQDYEHLDYGKIPHRLHPWTWIAFPFDPAGKRDSRLLRASRRVGGGTGYDHEATHVLVPRKTTLVDAEQILHGRPAWIVEFEDGSRDAVWWQSTPTADTTYTAHFLGDGTFGGTVTGYFLKGGFPGKREKNGHDSPRVQLIELWKTPR